MANIVWESKEECWCSDCGQIAVDNCSCEPCDVCQEYREDVEFREDVKDSENICFDCYTKIETEQEQCECCDLYDETVKYYDVENYDYLCKECYTDEIVEVRPLPSSINMLQKLARL